MKIGDMVKHEFIDDIERYGIIVEEGMESYTENFANVRKYFKVKYLPHPDLPFHGGDMYSEYTPEDALTVVSSI